MKTIYLLFILIGSFAFSTKSNGQNCSLTLSGFLKDRQDQSALEFAYIYIEEIKRGVYSDENGYYFFADLCPGNYHMVITHLGCETVTKFINLSASADLDILLEHNHHLLDEINIEGSASNQMLGLSKSTLTGDMILENSGKNLSTLLTNIPGVSSIQSGPGLSKPVIHGMYGNRVVILNQGIPQEGQQWGLDHAPEIDPNNVDMISVIKGSSAVKFGLQALGGVVVTEERLRNNDPHWHGSLKTGFQTNGNQAITNGCLRKAMKNGHIVLRGGLLYGGDKKTPLYYLTNTGNRQASFSGTYTRFLDEDSYHKFHYSFFGNETGIFRGSHIGNLTDLKDALQRDVPFYVSDSFSYSILAPRQTVRHHLAKYVYSKKLNETYQLSITGGWQVNLRKEYDIRRGNPSDRPSLNLNLFTQYYDFGISGSKKTAGFQYRQGNNINVSGTGISPLIPNYGSYQFALYYIQKLNLGQLPIEWGARSEFRFYDIQSKKFEENVRTKKFMNFAVNVGTKGKVGDRLDYYLDISYTGRPPEINELFSNGLHQGVSGIEEGNPALSTEHAFKIVNEWNGNTGKKHHLTFSIFGTYAKNYIYLTPTDELRLTIRGAFPVFKYLSSDVFLGGTTIRSIWQPFSFMTVTNALQYTYAQNFSLHSGLVYIPPLNTETNLTFVTGKTRWYNELKVGADIGYFARQNHIDESLDFAPSPPDYWLTNGFLRLKWKKGNQHDIDLVLRAENIFNVRYRNYMNRLRYFADEPGRNFYCTVYTTF